MLIEDGVDWMVYHAYDANQGGVPKLRIESIFWDEDGWPSLTPGGLKNRPALTTSSVTRRYVTRSSPFASRPASIAIIE